jgi:hypothetical protein
MPFTYNLPVPEIPPEALDESGAARLRVFLVDEGAWVRPELLWPNWRPSGR